MKLKSDKNTKGYLSQLKKLGVENNG